MTIEAGSGALTIKAAVSDGHVRAAKILSTRPVSVSRLFVGRPAREAPVLAGRLFSLCGYSHTIASRLAVATSMNADLSHQGFALGLLAERIGDSVRALVMGWPEACIAGLLSPEEIVPVRDVLAACRDLTAGNGDPSALVNRVLNGAKALEIGRSSRLRDRALTMVPSEQAFLPISPDVLTEDDDEQVTLSLEFQREAFAQLPYLPDRCVETGAFARCHDRLATHGSGLAARMEARIRDLEQAIADLENGADGLFSTGSLQAGQGYGAVESPRGRLYHWVKLDEAGLIADYGIVAPTEWNFHPAGPFVAGLLGAKVGSAATAQRLIAWLAAMFDPCVPFRVALAETDNA